jgi:hypothetical protein
MGWEREDASDSDDEEDDDEETETEEETEEEEEEVECKQRTLLFTEEIIQRIYNDSRWKDTKGAVPYTLSKEQAEGLNYFHRVMKRQAAKQVPGLKMEKLEDLEAREEFEAFHNIIKATRKLTNCTAIRDDATLYGRLAASFWTIEKHAVDPDAVYMLEGELLFKDDRIDMLRALSFARAALFSSTGFYLTDEEILGATDAHDIQRMDNFRKNPPGKNNSKVLVKFGLSNKRLSVIPAQDITDTLMRWNHSKHASYISSYLSYLGNCILDGKEGLHAFEWFLEKRMPAEDDSTCTKIKKNKDPSSAEFIDIDVVKGTIRGYHARKVCSTWKVATLEDRHRNGQYLLHISTLLGSTDDIPSPKKWKRLNRKNTKNCQILEVLE